MRNIVFLSLAAVCTLSLSTTEARADCNSLGTCLLVKNTGQGNAIAGSALAEGPVTVGVSGYSKTGWGVEGTALGGPGGGVKGASQTSGGVGGYFYSVAPGGTAVIAKTTGGTAMWVEGNSYFTGGDVFHTGSVTPWSDERMKKDINDLSYGLDQALKLHPVTFKMKEGDDRTRLGLIAQDVQKIVPEAVITDPKSGMLALDYVALTPVLINAVQEQQKLIRKQEARIAALEHPQATKLSSILGGGAFLGIGMLPLGLVLAFRRKRQSESRPAA